MKTSIKSICLLIVFILSSASAFAGIQKGPYLLFEGDNTSMSVLWQTDGQETNTIRWGTDTSYSMGQSSVGTYGTAFQHKYVITGLQPETKYYYQVDGYGSGSFRTAPDATATAVKLFAYGDTRSTPSAQEQVVGTMRAAYLSDPDFQTISLHAGDWVASNSESKWTKEWFVNTNPQMHAFQAEVPIVGVRGNHEGSGTVFKKYFPEPYVGGFYWSFDYGPAHIAIVDQFTPYAPGSAQYNWLNNDLAASSKPWKLVVLHGPGWTAGGMHPNNKTVQTKLQPLFKKYHVKMVIGGHNHYYSRAVVDNIQHLTLGGGGAPLMNPSSNKPFVAKAEESYHHAEIDINGDTMIFTARRADGTVIESVTIISDTIKPVISDFTIPLTSESATVAVSLTATDNVGVTGYCLSETNDSSVCTWQSIAPSTYTFAGIPQGVATPRGLYAFVQDADGNISDAAQVSTTITLVTVPGAPVIGTATAGNAQATVTFSAPGYTGGSAITGYTAASKPAGGVDSNAGSLLLSHTITGLTNGTAYTFTVNATNAKGTSAASAKSNSVTPR